MTGNTEKIIAGTGETLQVCTFRLSDRLFGVNILDVREISSDVRITPIHHAPKAVRGYMNIRGQIHLVVDLRRVFGFEAQEPDSKNKVVIFKPAVDEPFGVLVDSVSDVVTVSLADIGERRAGKTESAGEKGERRKAGAELTRGICKLEKDLLVLVNPGGILGNLENGGKA